MPHRLVSRQNTALARELAHDPSDRQPDAATPAVAGPVPVADDEVRVAAYHLWEAAGRPAGDGVRFWLAAERQVQGG